MFLLFVGRRSDQRGGRQPYNGGAAVAKRSCRSLLRRCHSLEERVEMMERLTAIFGYLSLDGTGRSSLVNGVTVSDFQAEQEHCQQKSFLVRKNSPPVRPGTTGTFNSFQSLCPGHSSGPVVHSSEHRWRLSWRSEAAGYDALSIARSAVRGKGAIFRDRPITEPTCGCSSLIPAALQPKGSSRTGTCPDSAMVG